MHFENIIWHLFVFSTPYRDLDNREYWLLIYMGVACTKPSVSDCFVITKQSPTEGLVKANMGVVVVNSFCKVRIGSLDHNDVLNKEA